MAKTVARFSSARYDLLAAPTLGSGSEVALGLLAQPRPT